MDDIKFDILVNAREDLMVIFSSSKGAVKTGRFVYENGKGFLYKGELKEAIEFSPLPKELDGIIKKAKKILFVEVEGQTIFQEYFANVEVKNA